MYFIFFVGIFLELCRKFGKEEKEEWWLYRCLDREMKTYWVYKVLLEKVNLILVFDGRNEISLFKFNFNVLELIMSIIGFFLFFRVFEYFKNLNGIIKMF